MKVENISDNYLFDRFMRTSILYPIHKLQDKKASPAASVAGKKPPPVISNPTENGLLEGISSLHSWIKSQTMIKPAGREKDANAGVVRTNYNNDEVNNTISEITSFKVL